MNLKKYKTQQWWLPLGLYMLLCLAGCSPSNTLQGVFKKQTPHEKYQASLKEAKLDQTALGAQWVTASQKALQKPIPVSLPFKETGYFPADKPMAASYSFTVKEGQKVAVKVETQGQEAPLLFIDLFELDTTQAGAVKHVAYADTTGYHLNYEIDEEVPHLLRVQPELLRSGQYTVTIETMPTLAFPVQGKDSRAVQSFWGADRDAGARRHEGIDIFAPRRTPVVAAVAGVVSRVNETPIGGKVVWLSDIKHRRSLYYAHLDSQLVQPGQRVSIGDTLGLMGNTGNAITTAPHLHFGIYRYGEGAIDPYPYVYQDRTKPAPLQADAKKLGNWVRVAKPKVTLRQAPSTASPALQSLAQHAPLKVVAGAANWYRVLLPSGEEGYVSASLVESLEKPLQAITLKQPAALLDNSSLAAATQKQLPRDSVLRVLARQQDFWLVKDASGTTGWVSSQMAL